MHTYFVSSRGPKEIAGEEFVVAQEPGLAVLDHTVKLATKIDGYPPSRVTLIPFINNLKTEDLSPRLWTMHNEQWHFIVIEVD